MNILFVCAGNVSRSFLAEALLRHELRPLGMDHISVLSAGLHAYPGSPADPEMVRYLSERGVPVPPHEAKQMAGEDADWADKILVMEEGQALMIKELWPRAGDKVEHLGGYITPGHQADDIIDPFGRTPYHYRLAQSQITMAVVSLLKTLA